MIIIGDVHGCYKTLVALLEKLPKDRNVTFVGDLIDRGPDSKEVVRLVREKGYRCVKGNHEDMAKNNPTEWLKHGGMQTFSSYGDDEKQWEEDLEWLNNLPLYLEFPELKDENHRSLLVTHSSAGCCWDLDKEGIEFPHMVMWNRVEPTSPEGYFNVFGHTPQKNGPFEGEGFANIDTGVYFENGVMTAYLFPEKITITQELVDDVKWGHRKWRES